MNLLEELVETYDYELEERDGKTIGLYREQYLDNGYGTYFYASIWLDYDINEDDITNITIDDMEGPEIEKRLDRVVAKCPYIEKHDECGLELATEDLEEFDAPCENCIYYSMIHSLYESINSGNW